MKPLTQLMILKYFKQMLEDMSLAMIGAMTNPKRCIFLVTKTFGKENGNFLVIAAALAATACFSTSFVQGFPKYSLFLGFLLMIKNSS